MLRPAANSNVPVPNTANLNRMSVPHTLMEASEVNGWQHLTQQFRGASGDITGIPTTMSSGASKSIIPAKESIITYGHKKDSTGRLIEAAVGIKGKESGILSITKPKTGLLEGANEASAAYKRVQANMASPTSVAVEHSADAANKAPYNSRAFESMFIEQSGAGNVASHTLPTQNMPNVKLAGKGLTIPGTDIHIPFDLRGYPVFDKYIIYETKLPNTSYICDRSAHMRQSTRDLRNSIQTGEINANIFTERQLQQIKSGSDKISGYTWHHHQDGGRMQLIPEDIHDLSHVGGYSLWGK
jgi:hypothetical protein